MESLLQKGLVWDKLKGDELSEEDNQRSLSNHYQAGEWVQGISITVLAFVGKAHFNADSGFNDTQSL